MENVIEYILDKIQGDFKMLESLNFTQSEKEELAGIMLKEDMDYDFFDAASTFYDLFGDDDHALIRYTARALEEQTPEADANLLNYIKNIITKHYAIKIDLAIQKIERRKLENDIEAYNLRRVECPQTGEISYR